jgi:hypothetical protein
LGLIPPGAPAFQLLMEVLYFNLYRFWRPFAASVKQNQRAGCWVLVHLRQRMTLPAQIVEGSTGASIAEALAIIVIQYVKVAGKGLPSIMVPVVLFLLAIMIICIASDRIWRKGRRQLLAEIRQRKRELTG